MVRLKHPLFSVFVVFIYGASCVTAPLPVGESPREKIGIVRASELPELERTSHRVRQWLEGIEGLEAEVEVATSPLKAQRLRLLLEREQLAQLADRGARATLEGGQSPEDLKTLFRDLAALQKKLTAFPGFGPERVNAALSQALFALKQEDEPAMKRALKEARAILIGSEPDWFAKFDPEESHPWVGHLLEQWRHEKGTASCIVDIKTSPEDASLSINGFSVARQNALPLRGGSTYEIVATAEGYTPEQTSLRCPLRHTQKQIRLTLKKGPSEPIATLELGQIATALRLKTLVLLDKSESSLKLYLFTPPKSLDVIPMSSLALQEGALPSDGMPPAARDAFLDMYRRHLASSSLSIDPVSSTPVAMSLHENIEETTGWYNDWKFWAIAGGVAGAVLATVLLTRGEPISHRPSNLKIQLQ